MSGLCKNWGVTAGMDVMLNPMLWCWLHIPGFQNGREFLKQSFTSAGPESGIGCIWLGSKSGKARGGWVLDGLVSLTIKIGWFHLVDTIR